MRTSNRFVAVAPDRGYRRPARPVTRLFRPANDNRPFKPVRHPYPGVPFGKRVPKPGEVGPARLPRLPQWSRYLKYGVRLVPAVSLGLSAWELYQWYNSPRPAGTRTVANVPFSDEVDCNPTLGPGGLYLTAANPYCWQDIAWGRVQDGPPDQGLPPPGYSGWLHQGLITRIRYPEIPSAATYMWSAWKALKVESVPGVVPDFWIEPAFVPIPQPMPLPQRVPLPHPFRPPGLPQPLPRPWPSRYPRPGRLPEDRVSEEPVNRNPYERPSPRPRPIRKREKEPPKRRVTPTIARRLRTALGKIVGGASEAAELIDAMYEALPDEIRTAKDDTLVKKLDRIFQNADKIDVAKFIENAVKNQKEDAVWGDGWQKIADTFDIGSPTGIKLGFPR